MSRDRILTTHVGSLPRSPELSDLLIRQEAGEVVDLVRLKTSSAVAVTHVVERQIAAGVDIVNDGEQPRVGFQTYVAQRMEGFGGASSRPRAREFKEFPAFARQMAVRFPKRSKVSDAPQALAAIHYDDLTPAREECEMFEAALTKSQTPAASAFMTSASPGIIATTLLNAHYATHEDYVFAIAREMRKEYELILSKGFTLQLDAPDLAMERTMLFQDKTLAEFLEIIETHVAALNEAIAGLPRDRIRLHCCWGNWEGPHIHDVPLRDILPLLYQAKVGGLSLEFANPRHQHEYVALPQESTAAGDVSASRRNRLHDQLRRASGSRRKPHLRSRGRGRRSQPCGCEHRLWLRYVCRRRIRGRRRRLGETRGSPRGRRPRDGAALGTRRSLVRAARIFGYSSRHCTH